MAARLPGFEPAPPGERTTIHGVRVLLPRSPRLVTMGVVLEGASVGQAGRACADEPSAPAVRESVRVPAPESDTPRREIWFRRRVSLIRAMRELWHFRELIVTLAE